MSKVVLEERVYTVYTILTFEAMIRWGSRSSCRQVFPWLDPRHSVLEFPAGCAWAFRGAIEGGTSEVG